MKVVHPSQISPVCDTAAGCFLDHIQICPSSSEGSVWAVATDGCIAAVVPREGDTHEVVYIHRSDLRPRVVTEDPITGVKYPDVAYIVPDLDGCLMIRVDYRLMFRLGQALAGDGGDLTLFIDPADGPIGVLGQHGIGALMPMIVGPEEVSRYSAVRTKFINDMKGKS